METKKEIIIRYIRQYDRGGYSLDEVADDILLLFGVMESDCEHEWINHSFDQFGFLQDQVCDKCGAKQSVP